MDDDELELKENISRMPDEKLLEMVTTKSNEYRDTAVYFAKNELKARGIDYDLEPEPALAPALAAAESAGPFTPSLVSRSALCPMCGEPLRSGTLVAEKELTIVFSDNREERFVVVTACRKCGQVSLAVDYDTTVE